MVERVVVNTHGYRLVVCTSGTSSNCLAETLISSWKLFFFGFGSTNSASDSSEVEFLVHRFPSTFLALSLSHSQRNWLSCGLRTTMHRHFSIMVTVSMPSPLGHRCREFGTSS